MIHSHLAMTVALLVTCLVSCTSTQLTQNRKAVTSISFSPDNELLAATSKGIFLFDTTNWKKKDLKKLIVTGAR